ncbi:UDP-glycosyltransferase 90A1-like [Salvia divinorum]|uniref:UDP-glycosyltransferase 90A1-like n=1 Tax=Salvia divinorum TaxID=28513 RepID=A0ABD1ICW9_SALDI
MGSNSPPTLHFAIFPFLSQGHIIPLLHLSRLLHRRSAAVTIFTTAANSPPIRAALSVTTSLSPKTRPASLPASKTPKTSSTSPPSSPSPPPPSSCRKASKPPSKPSIRRSPASSPTHF